MNMQLTSKQMILPTAVFFACAFASVVAADDPSAAKRFLRFVPDADGGRLETNITSYRNADGVLVDLVGAVHIADTSYYEELDRRFLTYDALLYELIAPEGARPRPNQSGGSLIGMFQRLLKNVLGLNFQLDAIDYTRKNFVHADMDPETFSRYQQERGETLLMMMFKVWLESMKRELRGEGTGPTPEQMMRAFSGNDLSRGLKLLFAQELQNMELMLAGIEPDGKDSVIVGERNKVAMRVLERELKNKPQRVGIFYGAAHMVDMEARLIALGFEKTGEEWLSAWTIAPIAPSTPPPAPAEPKSPTPPSPPPREEDV
ncbi:MAG: hypothetical protein ACKVX7_12140 [Planctomycetota bacterium]